MTGPLFANYLMVDWSASSVPKQGPNSIWWGILSRQREGYSWRRGNPATRQQAFREIRSLLMDAMMQGGATLAGFDFPLGYPQGFAEALGLEQRPGGWLPLWREIARRIHDRPDNHNTRFATAMEWNQLLTGGPAPFWGCPKLASGPCLQPRKPKPWPERFPEFRLCEQRVPGVQPVWKLYGAGSVGSQALTGIPCVLRLYQDIELNRYSRVWPFQTGLAFPFGLKPTQSVILFTEVWPSMLTAQPRKGEVTDEGQVRRLAEWLARMDARGKLSKLLSGPAELGFRERERVECEEGWILGASAVPTCFAKGDRYASPWRG